MSSEELLTHVDEHDNVLDLKPRNEFNNGKLIHRSVYLLLFNNKDEILVHKRPDSKKWHPGLYTFSIAGSVGDETYQECMERIIQNSLHASIPFKELFKFHHFDDVDKAFKIVYTGRLNNASVLKKSKLSFQWFTPSDLEKKLKINPDKFAPPFLTGMKLYFEKYRAKL